MTTHYRAREVRLLGPPQNAKGTIEVELDRRTVVPISLRLANEDGIYRASLRPLSHGIGELRIRLPRQTPPGVYRGRGKLGKEEWKVAVDVVASSRVRVLPAESCLVGPPGGTSDFEVTVLNRGNVPLDVPPTQLFDLDDEKGQEGALGRTSRASLKSAEGRADRFFEELRANHAGEARVVVAQGAGVLGAGEARVLKVRLHIPVGAKEGRTYSGVWEFGPATHGIVLDIAKRQAKTPRRKRQ